MSNNSLIPIVILGLGICTIVIPILISHIQGKNIKGYEYGVHVTPGGFSPYCKYRY